MLIQKTVLVESLKSLWRLESKLQKWLGLCLPPLDVFLVDFHSGPLKSSFLLSSTASGWTTTVPEDMRPLSIANVPLQNVSYIHLRLFFQCF